MLRRCVPAAIITPWLLASGTPAVNDYKQLAAGKVCPESERIQLPCGSCGPSWGELQDCEDQCNAQKACSHITYFDDKGCRIYSACDLMVEQLSTQVGTVVYERNNPAVVPIPPAAVTVHAGQATHEVNPLYMGCHSDTGYTHQARGFSSQLLFGESFEAAPGESHTWQQTLLPSTAKATVELASGGFHGQTALHVAYASGTGLAALGNRGIGNEGLYLQKGKEYEGYLYVKAEKSVKVHVALLDYTNAPPRPTPTGNNYEKLSHGQVCEESARIAVPCHNCGPNWGNVNKCEAMCNEDTTCTHITFFEDQGCRIYSACVAPSAYSAVGTDVYKRNNPAPVPPTPPGKVLAEKELQFNGGDWTRVNFTLTPTADAQCEGIAPGSDPAIDCGKLGPGAGHICVRCAGQFAVGLSSPGDMLIDFVWLQPGEWGRLAGLPVLKDTIDTLQAIGITAIRQGGSFTDPAYYFWKNWRGPVEQRPSVGATWGRELISSWGPFEMIDMCDAAGFEPIITTTGQSGKCCAPEDMADLVEYCWGGASTKWGALRIADGHPDPYKLRFIELGNEQYNSNYVDQVAAMEKRAKSLGKGGKLYYISPNNNNWLHTDDAIKAEALGLKDHLLEDFHVGAGGAIESSKTMFAANTSWNEGMVNLETNDGHHEMRRALAEAADLNEYFNQFIPPTSGDGIGRIKARTASFCTERSGHYDAFDQGITFFLPNGSWIQPPGYVHKMIHESWLPDAVAVDTKHGLSCSAQKAKDGSKLRLLMVNNAKTEIKVAVNVEGMVTNPIASITTLTATDLGAANPAGQPSLVSPTTSQVTLRSGSDTLTVPGYSFTSVLFDKAHTDLVV